MLSQKEMQKVFQLALSNNSTPEFILNGVDYYQKITSSPDLISAQEELHGEERVSFTNKRIAQIYITKKGIPSNDNKTVRRIFNMKKEDDIGEILESAEVQEIKTSILRFKERAEQYKKRMAKYARISPLTFEITEMINMKHFNMFDNNDNPINVSKINLFFNALETTENVQIIILCNSDKKLVYKVNNEFPIYNIKKVLDSVFKENTINLFYEHIKKNKDVEVKRAVLDFDKGICDVEVPVKRKNDDTMYFVNVVIGDVIKLKDNDDLSTVFGELDVKGVSQLPYDDFYEFLVSDPSTKDLFFVNERNKPWCTTKKYFKAMFFDPLSLLLKDFVEQELFHHVEIKIMSKTTSDKCSIKFKSKNIELVDTMAIYFSKIVGIFFDKVNIQTISNYESAFSSTVLAQLKKKAGILIDTIKEVRSTGKGYSSKCQGDDKPIVIDDDEIDDYESFGREVETLVFEDTSYNFVCMNQEKTAVEFKDAEIIVKSGNTKFPCCSAKPKGKKTSTKVRDRAKTRTSSSLKEYGQLSVVENSSLSDFLRNAFLENMKCSTFFVGTCFLKGAKAVRSINDSFIGALILAQSESVKQYDQPVDYTEFNLICENVRGRMMRLPYEILAQELYDIPYKRFCEDMSNGEHFIDPYFYTRALEVIFQMNIITFSSRVDKRKYPSTYEESKMEIPTIEIPRCSQYYTRKFNPKWDTVLIFKNYGSERAGRNIPSCELISISTENDKKGSYIYSFPPENKRFNEEIFNHFYNCCTPLFIDNRNNDLLTYEDPYIGWNPNKLGFGKVKGQELNMYGKTELLIYDDWNVVIPPIQPLVINKDIEEPFLVYDNKKPKYSDYNIVYKRAPLKTLEECMQTFDVTLVDKNNDGVWIEFQGIKQGLKILCEKHEFNAIHYDTVETMIQDENNVSGLLQLINWLWRSEYTEEKGTPSVARWIKDKIDTSVDNSEVDKPKKCLNNLYLPEFETFEERMAFCRKLWPFFFKEKITMPEGLFKRIMNLMDVQDKHTRLLFPEEYFGQIPKFITGLIPTQNDYKTYNSIIFTKTEQLKHWIASTNRINTTHISITNMNVMNRKIYEQMSFQINPYFYKDHKGKIYLIQNILDLDKRNCAIEVAYIWSKSKINLGPHTNSKSYSRTGSASFVIYRITDANEVVPSVNKTNDDINYLSILNYRNGSYAAMLPIL